MKSMKLLQFYIIFIKSTVFCPLHISPPTPAWLSWDPIKAEYVFFQYPQVWPQAQISKN